MSLSFQKTGRVSKKKEITVVENNIACEYWFYRP